MDGGVDHTSAKILLRQRIVIAPHLNGYFQTGETRFTLVPMARGGTRLTVDTVSVLRIDPALYWQPLARVAIRLNLSRVLQDVKQKAEMH